MFTHTLPQPPLDSRPNIPALSFDGRYGLPNSVREALFALQQGEASLLIDALLYCGFKANTLFTFRKANNKLVEAGFKMSPMLVRRALNSGIFKCTTVQTHRPGRPEKVYTMPEVSALVKEYAHGHMSASDQVIVKDMHNLRLYRQALHREFIRRAPGAYSRAFLSRRLGVGERSTANYDVREGIRAIRRRSQQNLRYYPDWREMVRAAKPGLNWLRVCYKNGRSFNAPALEGIAERHLWKKNIETVYLMTQRCNRYIYAPEPDWADHQYLYLNDDERSFAKSSDPKGLRKERLSFDPISATLSIDRKAYQPKSDPISAWVPPEMAAKRISTNPHLPRYQA